MHACSIVAVARGCTTLRSLNLSERRPFHVEPAAWGGAGPPRCSQPCHATLTTPLHTAPRHIPQTGRVPTHPHRTSPHCTFPHCTALSTCCTARMHVHTQAPHCGRVPPSLGRCARRAFGSVRKHARTHTPTSPLTNTPTHQCTHECTHQHTHTPMNARTHACAHTFTACRYTCTYAPSAHKPTNARAHACAHTFTRTFMYEQMQTRCFADARG